MPFDVITEHNVPVLAPAGRFDAYEMSELDTWFEENVTDHSFIIMDFNQVTFIDTRALSTLVKWMKKLRENEGDLKLIRFSNPVRIIFELSRLDKAFSIYTNLTDALADCEERTIDTVAEAETFSKTTHEPGVNNVQAITLSKRLDAFRIPELQEQYGDLITQDNPFAIIDLSAVEFLDSAALAWLVKMLKQAQSSQGDVVLVRSKIDVANRIFQLTQFDKVFKFADSVEDAVKLLA